MNKQESIVATVNFYEANTQGSFSTTPSSVYKLKGEDLESIKSRITEILWQAVEIEGFDNSEIFVEMEFEQNGEYLDRDEFCMTPATVRTSEPSDYIVWGNKKPYLFKIDRTLSDLNINYT